MINKATMLLVMEEEAFMAKPYSDLGKPAIGYGRRDGYRGFILKPDMVITKEQAYEWLRSDLYYLAGKIKLLLKDTKVNSNELGALASFSYNLGISALAKSTLLKKLLAGDRIGAADEFLKWNKAKVNGVRKELKGLTKRRNKERELFLKKET